MINIVTMADEQANKPKRGAAEKYPFSKLAIGQGFKMPDGTNIASMRVLASNRGKSLGFKFSVSANGYVSRTA